MKGLFELIKNEYTLKTIEQLLELSNIIQKRTDKAAQVNSVTIPTALQMKCLSIINTKTTINMSSLAKELLVSKQQCTVIVNSLSKKGYITRNVNPRNRREILLETTPSANRLLHLIRVKIENSLYEVFDSLSLEDKKRFIDAAKIIVDIVNKIE